MLKIKRSKLPENKRKPLKKAFKEIDRYQLAMQLNSSVRYIDQVANGLNLVSPRRALIIEELTKGKLKASLLRPDIFGNGK